MTAPLCPCVFACKHDKLRSITCVWHLFFLGEGGGWVNARRALRQTGVRWRWGCWLENMASDQADISGKWPAWPERNFIRFPQSGPPTSGVIGVTRGKQKQSVAGVWATGLMWQIWERRRVRDRRGTQGNSEAQGADPQSRPGKLACRPWHVALPLQPQLSHETLAGSIRRQLAYFQPSVSPSVRLHRHLFISIHASVQSVRLCVFLSDLCSFLLSFIRLWMGTVIPSSLASTLHLWPRVSLSSSCKYLQNIYKSSFIFHTQETADLHQVFLVCYLLLQKGKKHGRLCNRLIEP